jgi:membrane dipeptidase
MPEKSQAPIPVFDGHNDTLLSLAEPGRGQGRSFFERSEHGHIDLPRAKEGGFAGGFFATFVPAPPELNDMEALKRGELQGALELGYASSSAQRIASGLFRLEREGGLEIVRSVAQIEACMSAGRIAAILHLEGADAIDAELDALEIWHAAGLRSLGIVWSRRTIFGDGVPFVFPSSPDTGPGLTEAGGRLVARCNQLGILIDLSHLNEAGFWDVARLSSAPLVATHSNVHALCASSRNLTDKQLAAVRESDGLVGLNFGVGFLHPEGDWEADVGLEVMRRHLDYLIEALGETRVALGSDFDGAKVPSAIGDVTGLPRLFEHLRAAGYDQALLERIAWRNWLRVLDRTWHD